MQHFVILQVDLSGCYQVTEAGLHFMANKCAKLQNISLKGTSVTILPAVIGARYIEIDMAGFPCISPDLDLLKKTGMELMIGMV